MSLLSIRVLFECNHGTGGFHLGWCHTPVIDISTIFPTETNIREVIPHAGVLCARNNFALAVASCPECVGSSVPACRATGCVDGGWWLIRRFQNIDYEMGNFHILIIIMS